MGIDKHYPGKKTAPTDDKKIQKKLRRNSGTKACCRRGGLCAGYRTDRVRIHALPLRFTVLPAQFLCSGLGLSSRLNFQTIRNKRRCAGGMGLLMARTALPFVRFALRGIRYSVEIRLRLASSAILNTRSGAFYRDDAGLSRIKCRFLPRRAKIPKTIRKRDYRSRIAGALQDIARRYERYKKKSCPESCSDRMSDVFGSPDRMSAGIDVFLLKGGCR